MEYYCNICNQSISQEVYAYSQRYFRTPLCRDHQKKEREKEASSKAVLGTKSLDEVIYNSRVMDNSNSSSKQNENKLEVVLKDPRAIKIAKAIPTENRNVVLEKYIILGEMVVSHASISTNKETIEEFFSPLKNDIEMIRQQIRLIIPSIAAPAKKGKMTVDTVFESLREHFMDDSFEDVSSIGKYADVLATTADSKTSILIEMKDYSNTVPEKEIEKFWRDIERRGTKYGIFISMRSGICKCSSCISLKTEMNKTAIFVNNSELNYSGHLFAYYVIKKIAELQSVHKKELSGEEVSQVIAKVNRHVRDLQNYVESINKIEDIADGLQTTCKKKLDELISCSNAIKKNMNEGINEILIDLEKIET
jgi:hypothetical protein